MDCLVDDCDTEKTVMNPYDSGGYKGVRFSLSRESARNKTAQKVRESGARYQTTKTSEGNTQLLIADSKSRVPVDRCNSRVIRNRQSPPERKRTRERETMTVRQHDPTTSRPIDSKSQSVFHKIQ